MPLWGLLLCFVIATLWAASPIMISRGLAISKCTANEVNPLRAVSFLIVSTIAALIYSQGHIAPLASYRALLWLLINVFLTYIVGDVLYFTGIKEIGISMGIPISNSYPVLTAFTSWMILDEELSLRLLINIVMVAVGLLLLHFGAHKDVAAQPSATEKEKLSAKRLIKGFAIAIGAAIAWALSAPFMKLAIIDSGISAVELTFYRAVIFAILAWGSRLVTARTFPAHIVPFKQLHKQTYIYFLAAPIIGLWLGSVLNTICLTTMPVAVVTAVTSTSPFMAALFGHFVLKDRLTSVQWVGVGMIITASITLGL
ncbi:MAG: DMT family transporter [Synergistaceae bacterium]|nr:DMT family transporter [Synergistaceae bacterium]